MSFLKNNPCHFYPGPNNSWEPWKALKWCDFFVIPGFPMLTSRLWGYVGVWPPISSFTFNVESTETAGNVTLDTHHYFSESRYPETEGPVKGSWRSQEVNTFVVLFRCPFHPSIEERFLFFLIRRGGRWSLPWVGTVLTMIFFFYSKRFGSPLFCVCLFV